MKKELLESIDNSKVFFEKLFQVKKEQELKDILLEINNEEHINICNIAVNAITNQYNPFEIHGLLKKSIPLFDLEIDAFIIYLRTVYEAMEGDFAVRTQYDIIKDLVTEQPKFARDLLDKMLEIDEDTFIEYMAILFEGLSELNKDKGYSELLKLLHSDSHVTLQAAIFALGELIFKDNDRLKAETFVNRLDELSTLGEKDLYYCIVRVLCRIYKLNMRSISIIFNLCKTKETSVYYQISNFLFQKYSEIMGFEWFSKLLLVLTDVSCKNKGIIDEIDYVLGDIMKSGDTSLVKLFLEKWIIKSDYKKQYISIDKLFDSLFVQMINDREFYCELLTEYLMKSEQSFNIVARDMVSYAKLHKLENIRFDKKTVLDCTYNDMICLCIKSIGYIFDVKYLFEIEFSLLKICSEEEIYLDEIIEIFYEFVCKNYPHTILKYLQANMDVVKSNCKFIELFKRIEKLMAEENAYNLKEIKQPSRYRKHISLEQGREMSKQMEGVRSEFSFIDLCSKVSLKYGNGHFQNNSEGDYGEVRGLQSIIQSVELPKSQLSHRVSDEIQRIQFRLIGRRFKK